MIVMHGRDNNFTVTQAGGGSRNPEFEEVLMRALINNFMMNSVLAMHSNANVGLWPPFSNAGFTSQSGLTDEAINNLQSFTVDENTNFSTLGDCGITLDPFEIGDDVIALPCGHCYKADAVKGWLKDHTTCPICREQIKSMGDA